MTGARKSHPREESSYRNMKTRCNNPKATGYEYYGGRGIKVCNRWLDSFWNFYADMGPRPENTTLDRIDVDGNYDPENCRWATWEEQAVNKTDTEYFEIAGEKLSVKEWADKLDILPNTITYRLIRGWSIEEALELKARKRAFYSGRVTQFQLEFIQQELLKGATLVDIAKQIGIDNGQISRLYRKFGMTKPVRVNIKKNRAIGLRNIGWTLQQIADELKCSMSSVSHYCKRK